MKLWISAAVCSAVLMTASSVGAQVERMNFADRKAVIIANAADKLELSGFSFENTYERSTTRLRTNLKWKNIGSKPIQAFEVVVLYYDPFNRRIERGGRWMVPGHDSANWSPLQPGEQDGDGLLAFDDEPVQTGIVYVRAIRYTDGDVWMSNQNQVETQIKAQLPTLKEIGTLDPGAPKVKAQ